MAGISSDIIRGYNDTIILYLLLDKPSYGYEISKQIKALSDEKYIMKETGKKRIYNLFSRCWREWREKAYILQHN